MSFVFFECSKLEEIKLNFNCINVTNMSNMFSGCNSLKEIILSSFNNKNITDMSDMFCKCSSINI